MANEKVPKLLALTRMSESFNELFPYLAQNIGGFTPTKLSPYYDRVMEGNLDLQDPVLTEVDNYMKEFALQVLIRNVFEHEEAQHG